MTRIAAMVGLTVLAGAFTVGAVRAQELVIAENGRSAFRIVVADDASPSTRYAAEELAKFLQEMTGADLPLVSDKTTLGKGEIIVGDNAHLKQLKTSIDFARLGKEGYVLRTVGDHLVIAGSGVRGALYGVYGLLEDHLGCRWFTPVVSRIPKTPRLVVGPLDETKIPRLEYREPFIKDCFDGDWCARNRVNSNAASLEAKHGGKISYFGFVHTFSEMVPPDKYFKDHPEYFCLINGQRLGGYNQLCCTNEDVIRIITEEVRNRMRAHPEATVFSVSQNDAGNPCQCPNCQKLAEQEGTQAAPVLYLVNRVAEAVEKEFPDQVIDTLAYQWSRKPPETMRPRPNVIVRLCSIECCFAHPLASCDSPEDKAFREDIVGWGKVCNRLWVWDYTTSFANYFVPFPNRRSLRPNIRFFADNHVTGIFEEDTYTTLNGEFNSLDGYLQAKFLWDPDYDENVAMTEFLAGVYGKAAAPIREYIDLLQDKVANENIHMHIWEGARAAYLTDDLLTQADKLWDEAEAAVANEPEVLQRVRIARLSPDWAQIERTDRTTLTPYRIANGRYHADIDPAFKKRGDRFVAALKAGGVTALNEGGLAPATYCQRLDAKLGDFEVASLQTDSLRLDFVPGLGGRLLGLQLPGGKNLAYMGDPSDSDYPNHGGYAESWGGATRGAGWANRFDAKAAETPEGKTLTLGSDVGDGVRLQRVVTVPAKGSAFEVATTLANGRKDAQPGELRTQFALNLGSTDDLTAVIPGAGDKGTISLSLPETETMRDFSFTGAQAAQGFTIASHAQKTGVRVLPLEAPIERAWIRVDAKRSFVTVELKTKKGDVAPGASAGLRQRIEVLPDVSGVPQVPGTGAKTHRALHFILQDDQIPIGKYGEWGWIEEDPTAEDGFSVHLPNTHIEWCCQWWWSPSQFEPNTKYDVFARIRVDKKGENGSAFWAGIYDTLSGKGLGGVQPNVKDIPDKDWHLYKLGTVIPAKGQYVWLGPYGNPDNVGGVWVDYLEIKAAE